MQLDSREGIIIFTVPVNKAMNIRTSIIRMTVSSTDNATNITCTAISQFPPSSDISDPALLLVQGSYLHVISSYDTHACIQVYWSQQVTSP